MAPKIPLLVFYYLTALFPASGSDPTLSLLGGNYEKVRLLHLFKVKRRVICL